MFAYIPQTILKHFVNSIYFISGDVMGTGVAFPRAEQVIIINVGNNFHVSEIYDTYKPANELSSTVWINGKHDLHFMLGNSGTTAMYAIGVKLGMLPFFANLPASETNEQAVDAVHWTSPEIFNLREQLLACEEVHKGCLLIEQYLLQLLKQKPLHQYDKIKWLAGAMHHQSVQDICDGLGYTRKRLLADARYYFGASVKNIQGVIRFNHTLRKIANESQSSLSAIHEYYDQSHFINDFKARTGITPLQYRRLCQQFPQIKFTPNFLPITKGEYLHKING